MNCDYCIETVDFSDVIKITLTETDMQKVNFYCNWKATTLKYEKCQQNDLGYLPSRFKNGAIAEIAISKLLGKEWYYSFFGGSVFNNFPDLSYYGWNLGIKTSKLGLASKINTELHENQIVCIIKEDKYPTVYIMGICNQEIIDNYGDKSLVWGDLVEKNKTGFIRYDKLLPFTLEELLEYSLKIKQKRTICDPNNTYYAECITPEVVSLVKITNGVISRNPKIINISDNYDNQYFLELLNLLKDNTVIGFGILPIIQAIKLYNEKYFEYMFTINYIDLFEELIEKAPKTAVKLDMLSCYSYTSIVGDSLNSLCNLNNLNFNAFDSTLPILSINAFKCKAIYNLMLQKNII